MCLGKMVGWKCPLQVERSPLSGIKSPLQTEKSPLSSQKSPLQAEKSSLQREKGSLQDGKSSLQKEKNISSIEVVLIDLFSKDTASKIGRLYKTHGFKYSFNRENLAKILNSSSSYASRIISKCKQNGIIRMEKRGVYYFQKPLKDDQEG